MMACMYGTADKKMYPTAHYNGVTISTSEIGIKPMHTSGKEWTVSFMTEPAKVPNVNNTVTIIICQSFR